jgi:hypothetical protein
LKCLFINDISPQLGSKNESNSLEKDLQSELRKKTRQFPKSIPVIQKWRQEKKQRVQQNTTGEVDEDNSHDGK